MKLRDKNGCVAYMKTSTNPNGFNKRKKSRQDSTGIASDTPKAPTTVLSWGLGRYGGLGRNELGVDPSPREIPMLSGCTSSSYGKRVIQVTSGWKTSIAVTADGSVFEWGWNSKFFRTLFRAVRHPELTQVLQKIGDFFRSNSNILFSNILREPTPQLLFGHMLMI
jgi:alpha-tubulin suppressor-like RCC1 family protein